MSPDIENLRQLLQDREVEAFLVSLDAYRRQSSGNPVVASLTQRVLPPLLREAFSAESLSPASIVLLWRMVRESRLVVVENDILESINRHIDEAVRQAEPQMSTPVAPLATFKDEESGTASPRARGATGPVRVSGPVERGTSSPPAGAVSQMQRVALASSFTFGTWSSVDAFDLRKNLCASQQEHEFLRAVRQYFPSLLAYPNQPLRNFIDVDKLEGVLPMRVRGYAWASQVDVLLCTSDEDPVAGIELDSPHHDSEEAQERDALKNQLFKLAGITLIRIRAHDTKAVRAEDFYDLLNAQSQVLDSLRPRRLRPRRNHDFLVPAESATRATVLRGS